MDPWEKFYPSSHGFWSWDMIHMIHRTLKPEFPTVKISTTSSSPNSKQGPAPSRACRRRRNWKPSRRVEPNCKKKPNSSIPGMPSARPEKRGPWLFGGYVGDEILPSYMMIRINQYKDPYWTTSIMACQVEFVLSKCCACFCSLVKLNFVAEIVWLFVFVLVVSFVFSFACGFWWYSTVFKLAGSFWLEGLFWHVLCHMWIILMLLQSFWERI